MSRTFLASLASLAIIAAPVLARGDRVIKRGGDGSFGVISSAPSERGWVSIHWPNGISARVRPALCHVDELELKKE